MLFFISMLIFMLIHNMINIVDDFLYKSVRHINKKFKEETTMAKTTRVYFESILEYNNTSRIFRTIGNDSIRTLWAEGFEDSIVTVDPVGGCTITEFANTAAGCFNDDSNFGAEVLRAYNCDENTTFTSIKFKFNEVTLTVTKENTDA